MKYKKYKIIWVDPTGDSGWHTTKELDEFTPEECVIEAYVYYRDKNLVKTFASYSISKSGEITFGDVNALPRACITKMRIIK